VSGPLIVGIGSAHSNIGKTTLGVSLLRRLTQVSITNSLTLRRLRRWGVIKYTKTAIYASIVDDIRILAQSDKDTGRFLNAGAEMVLWAQSPPDELGEVLPVAIDRLSHLDGIIIEGNSAIEFIKPDIVIFITDPQRKRSKPSAEALSQKADIVLIAGEADQIEELVSFMDITLRKKLIEDLLKERCVNEKISCRAARGIAEELGIPYKDVGKAANSLKIKIKECELGCF
jgi:LAO/AO transport system kinase